MNSQDLIEKLKSDFYKKLLCEYYGEPEYARQKERFLNLISKFNEKFTDTDIRIISSPGRTELAGNHTDHNHGNVLAASIQLDSLAVAAPNESSMVKIWSEGFADHFSVDTSSLETASETEDNTTALIRGILSIFKEKGLSIGGFDAYISSDVLIGSGLSSSASIEILLGKILGVLFNGDSLGPVELAIIGQKAENEFLGKPCGLMDQVACAFGGIVAIDFANPAIPKIESVHYSFEEKGYRLLVIDTGGDHADLTDDYGAIPAEMKSIANALGHEVCRDIDESVFMEKIPELASQFGDRAILRVLHFIKENRRVEEMVELLKADDVEAYLEGVQDSGDSSYKYLQNVFTSKYVTTQKVSLAIALTEMFPRFHGAVRVHGGGFAGTVQVYVKTGIFEAYKKYMEHFFGIGSVTALKIRQTGITAIF